jgi:8-oxo-dGTP diphosphatase
MAKKLTYCPICGAELTQREEGGRTRPSCDECGYVHYHNPVPGVGLLIEVDDGIVLIQRKNPPHQGEWTLPSGFVEADESAEESAIREAEEETGLMVEIIELMGINSFPEGPPVSGIMIFYRMRPTGGTLRAGDDAADARVFQPDDVPLLPFRTHREIMAEWLAFRRDGRRDRVTSQPPSSEFYIRSFHRDDIEEVIGLLAMIPANRNLTPDHWRTVGLRLLEAPTLETFVAETHAEPRMLVGCIALSVARGLTDGYGIVNDMAVLPTFQRHGVGAELLEAVIRRAGQLNLGSLLVNRARTNDQARAFLAATGFKEIGILHLKIR